MHNEMMRLVWLLNTAGTTGRELQSLLEEFLGQRAELTRLEAFSLADEDRRAFWLNEMKLSEERLTSLHQDLAEAIALLRQLSTDQGGC